MAVPGVGRKLEKMLKVKEQKQLNKKSRQLESLAKAGNHMAQTVIGISNEMHAQSVGDIQKKLNVFDPAAFLAFKDEVLDSKPNSFFLMNLKSLANLGRSQSKEEVQMPSS